MHRHLLSRIPEQERVGVTFRPDEIAALLADLNRPGLGEASAEFVALLQDSARWLIWPPAARDDAKTTEEQPR
jgi:hypothetical protein